MCSVKSHITAQSAPPVPMVCSYYCSILTPPNARSLIIRMTRNTTIGKLSLASAPLESPSVLRSPLRLLIAVLLAVCIY